MLGVSIPISAMFLLANSAIVSGAMAVNDAQDWLAARAVRSSTRAGNWSSAWAMCAGLTSGPQFRQ